MSPVLPCVGWDHRWSFTTCTLLSASPNSSPRPTPPRQRWRSRRDWGRRRYSALALLCAGVTVRWARAPKACHRMAVWDSTVIPPDPDAGSGLRCSARPAHVACTLRNRTKAGRAAKATQRQSSEALGARAPLRVRRSRTTITSYPSACPTAWCISSACGARRCAPNVAAPLQCISPRDRPAAVLNMTAPLQRPQQQLASIFKWSAQASLRRAFRTRAFTPRPPPVQLALRCPASQALCFCTRLPSHRSVPIRTKQYRAVSGRTDPYQTTPTRIRP